MNFLSLMTRCKDEPFIEEFINYYLKEGIEYIYIIDDNSTLKYSEYLLNHPKVMIYFENNIIEKDIANSVYKDIKDSTEWLIYVDVDEYITTKKELSNTIRDELMNTFSDIDCIKIPWVMMSANKRDKNPTNLINETIDRWNHDKKHINTKSSEHKFRCRYEKIEVKCIFKPSKFDNIWDHHPKSPIGNFICVDSIYQNRSDLSPFYDNLREKDIKQAYLVCYHFRIISIENSNSKIKNNIWYTSYTIDDLMSSDYAEIIDKTLVNKMIK